MTESEDIDRAAAEWLVRRDREPLDDSQDAQFKAWLLRDSRHRAAYVRAARASGAMSRVSEAPRHEGARHRFAGRRIALVAASLVVMAVTAWHSGVLSLTQTYHANIGVTKRVQLADGSVAVLNTDSEIRVRYTPRHRAVELVSGEAEFEVNPDPKRPFDVTARDITTRAVGTAFVVRVRDAGDVELIVTEGRVLFGGDPELGIPVSAGQVADASEGRVNVHLGTPEEMAKRLAWREGYVVFAGDELGEAVAEMNRYHTRRLVLSDPEIAQLRIGGRFRALDLDKFVLAIERSFSLVSEPSANGDVVLRREELRESM